MPVWHVSLSLRTPTGELLSSPSQLERAGVGLLAGVGADLEWWHYNPRTRVGHLRVAVTTEENERIPVAPVMADAGESGPERKRSRR
jgi:hypothetical protein